MKKSFLRYNDYLKEALNLKDAKYYTKLWYDSGMENHLSEIFNNEYRIYLEIGDISLKNDIKNVLNNNNYELLDYDKGLIKKIGDDKNITKIGKVLTKLGYNDLTDKFNADYSRNNKKINNDDYLICISRHPYDIAGMSTDRIWDSCMNLTDGKKKEYVQLDIIYGTIIAYLIKKDDKNIKYPISRILIKPFINVKDKNDIIYVSDNKPYPTEISYKGFLETVNDWLYSWQINKVGIYDLHCKLYYDGKSREIRQKNLKSIIKTEDEIKNYLVNILNLKKFKILTYNNELVIDVNENVNMSNLLLDEIPFKFRNIKGDFDISNNKIKNFNNFPYSVSGDLIVKHNNIESLEDFYTIHYIGGDIDLSFNKIKKINESDFLGCKIENLKVNLYLNNNKIEIINGIKFYNSISKSLNHLDISNNIISYLNLDGLGLIHVLNLKKSISDYKIKYDKKNTFEYPDVFVNMPFNVNFIKLDNDISKIVIEELKDRYKNAELQFG